MMTDADRVAIERATYERDQAALERLSAIAFMSGVPFAEFEREALAALDRADADTKAWWAAPCDHPDCLREHHG